MIKQSEKKLIFVRKAVAHRPTTDMSVTSHCKQYVHFKCIKKDCCHALLNKLYFIGAQVLHNFNFFWRVENWEWIVHVTDRLTNCSLDTCGVEANYTI